MPQAVASRAFGASGKKPKESRGITDEEISGSFFQIFWRTQAIVRLP
jgi:hypothetical protein